MRLLDVETCTVNNKSFRYNIDLHRDVDVVEINEAFASMAVYCRDQLKLNWEDLNPRGGAIALGHPVRLLTVTPI